MRAHRGLTAAALALTTILIAPAGPAGADDDGEPPTAAAVAGAVMSWLYIEPSTLTYYGTWTLANGGAVSVSRGLEGVQLRLPQKALDLPLADPPTVEVVIENASGGVTVQSWQDDLSLGRVDVDLISALATAAGSGVTDATKMVVTVKSAPGSTTPDVSLDLLIEVGLENTPPGGDYADVTLPDPPDQDTSVDFDATPIRVTGGTRVGVTAWADFFADAPRPLEMRMYDAAFVASADLTASMTMTPDGSRLDAVAPADVADYRYLVVEAGAGTADRLTVYTELLPPSTDAVAAYVTSVYNDLFDRDPDPGGLATWTNALRSGTRYGAVADAITSSAEFRTGLIRDAYAYYLGRQPDPSGLAFWLEQMRKGMHIQEMEAGFLASAEYYRYAGSYVEGWITWMYLDVLGRRPAPSEVAFWRPIVWSHGRGEVAKAFLYSTERLTADVDGYYQWLLHRRLDPAGRTSWVRAIQSGTRVEAIIAGIISSAEYRNNVPVG